ncbi:type II toxin-antitoxin system VapC family toxin [Mycolicibacter arupensis]|uniref:type II toxin-antitoxin system VapC family toxin n=1 Tax=Mycolicibacter arupensis TaxID=342002 RepID=UPI003B3AFD56
MKVLLDTHTLLWLVSKPTNVDANALAVLADPETSVWVSSASAWEIATKTRWGRLDGAALLAAWSEVTTDMGSTDLDITPADAILAGRLAWEHRDPFDRVLVAQALRRNLTLATRDVKIIEAAIVPTLNA